MLQDLSIHFMRMSELNFTEKGTLRQSTVELIWLN